MSKILLHLSCPRRLDTRQTVFMRALDLKQQGDEVAIMYCAATAGTCAVNTTGNPIVCATCKLDTKRTAKKFGVKIVPLTISRKKITTKALREQKSQDILTGVYSLIISQYRLLKKDIQKIPLLKKIRRKYFETCYRLYESANQVIKEFNPARIELYTGRFACSRIVLMAAIQHNKAYYVLEQNANRRPIFFKNHSIHDVGGFSERILSNEANMEVAEEYFTGRSKGVLNQFALGFEADSLKNEYKKYKYHISLFLSSQDEFEALGKEWQTPFPNKHELVLELSRFFPDYYFSVRFHPNQATMKTDVTSGFKPLESLPNVQIYYPQEKVNSYKLIDSSDLIITFGSTVSVESCWRNKPAVIAGPAYFKHIDVAYSADSIDELKQLLEQGQWEVKSRENAARFANYAAKDGDDIAGIYVAPSGGARRSYLSVHKKEMTFPLYRNIGRMVNGFARWYLVRRVDKAWEKAKTNKT